MKQEAKSPSPPTSTTSSSVSRRALGGIFVQKLRWGLSLKGWLLTMSLGILVFLLVILTIYPFLAQNKQVSAKTLVVEAWLPEYALHEAGKIFRDGNYEYLFLTGGPFRGGVDMDANDTYPHRAQKYFRKIGLTNAVSIVFYQVKRDRTFTSALAFKNYVDQKKLPIGAFNLVTLGPHARRSRASFDKAFGGKAQIGVISLANREYEASKWWRYSEGVKETFSEGLAYLYSLFQYRGTIEKTSNAKAASLPAKNRILSSV